LAGEKFIPTGIGFLSLFVLYGIKEKMTMILLISPIVTFAAVLYGLSIFTEERFIGGYKKALEEKISSYMQSPILFWETNIAPLRHKDIAMQALYLVYFLFLGATSWWGILESLKISAIAAWIEISILSALFVFTVAGLSSYYSAFKKAYSLSHAKLFNIQTPACTLAPVQNTTTTCVHEENPE
jgi:hypothetical protein